MASDEVDGVDEREGRVDRGKIPERSFGDSWQRYWRVVNRVLPGARAPEDQFIDRLMERVPSRRWLDAGSGRQSFPRWRSEDYQRLREAGTSHFGCDLDRAALEESEIPGRVCAATLEQVPYAEGSFELVTSNMVFEHLTEPEAVVDELIRVTEPGGRIIIHTVNALHYSAWIAHVTPQWFHEWIVERVEGRAAKDVYPTQYKANTVGRLRRLFESRGATMAWGGEVTGIPLHFPFPGLFWVGIALGWVESWVSRVPMVGRLLKPNLLIEFQRPGSSD